MDSSPAGLKCRLRCCSDVTQTCLQRKPFEGLSALLSLDP
jgi:hypothetical protein